MTFSCGNSFGESAGQGLAPGSGEGLRHTVPPWLFGLRQSDDRGDM